MARKLKEIQVTYKSTTTESATCDECSSSIPVYVKSNGEGMAIDYVSVQIGGYHLCSLIPGEHRVMLCKSCIDKLLTTFPNVAKLINTQNQIEVA